ncbi:MAG: hypothetical protein ACREOW_04525 [Thermodesulfobacteriota bacterium]
MNKYGKRILSAMIGGGVVFMLLMVFGVSLRPSYAELVIQTIPQDDQLREKGIIILCPQQSDGDFESSCDEEVDFSPCTDDRRVLGQPDIIGFPVCVSSDTDFHAEYKVDFRLNGRNVDPDELECLVLQKDVCTFDGGEATLVVDVTEFFTCKFRSDPNQPGVGVIDVYFNEDGLRQANRAVFIGDHILKVVARADGNVGSEIQDICILGFASCRGFEPRFQVDSIFRDDCRSFGQFIPFKVSDKFFYTPNFFTSVFSGGEPFTVFADPLFPFASCKDAALWERTFFYDLSPPECRQFGRPD